MRAYISGGMTGWPDNNQEAFDEAAAWLTAHGHTAVSPVDLDREDGAQLEGDGFDASDDEYEGFLERDLALINKENLDAIVFVQGWKTSGGAGREGRRAIEEGLKLFVFSPEFDVLIPMWPHYFLKTSRTERLRREEVQ